MGMSSGQYKGMPNIIGFPWIHLLGKVNDLGPILGILKDHKIMSGQTDCAMFFVLVEQVLHDVNHTDVAMMTPFGE